MPTLPWRSPAGCAAGAEAVVLASRFAVSSAHRVPGFALTALVLRRHALASDGALGVSLSADLRTRTLWTLSAWRDHAALDAFVQGHPHLDAMRRHRGRTLNPVFISWTVPAAALPVGWEEARRRVAEAENPPDA